MISYKKALNILSDVAQKTRNNHHSTVSLKDSLGHHVCNAQMSSIDVPSFDNSAMDGFVFNSHLLNTDQQKPIKIPISGLIQAGDTQPLNTENSSDKVFEIMTGAPIPNGLDTVIPIECVNVRDEGGDTFVSFKPDAVKPGANVRRIGTDYQRGQEVCAQHTQIQPQHIMALATVGVKSIDVLNKIPIAIISTGSELVAGDVDLAPGKIHNSNQPFIDAYSSLSCCQPIYTGSCHDDEDSFNKTVNKALEKGVKIIISTGAVSKGKFDFIPRWLQQHDATVHFHKVKVRPGKPILFAQLASGVIYFGLPGNPIAAASGMRFFVDPLVRSVLGIPVETTIKARLTKPISKKRGFKSFSKAHACVDDNGQFVCHALQGQGSFQTQAFAQSNCWLILAEEQEHIEAGQLVDILPILPNQLPLC